MGSRKQCVGLKESWEPVDMPSCRVSWVYCFHTSPALAPSKIPRASGYTAALKGQ